MARLTLPFTSPVANAFTDCQSLLLGKVGSKIKQGEGKEEKAAPTY